MKDHTSATTRYSLWRKVIEQVRTGSMPPEGESPLPDADKQHSWVGFKQPSTRPITPIQARH